MFRSDWEDPVSTTYRGLTVAGPPPNSQAATALHALKVLEGFDLADPALDPVDRLHLAIETVKLSLELRNRTIADPRCGRVDLEELLGNEAARRSRTRISLRRARPMPIARWAPGDTAHFVVADGRGNVVSAIQSLYFSFGSGLMAEDTGILLQNRGVAFSLDQSDVSRLEPGKRPLHTLMPLIVAHDRLPVVALGSMGGDGQVQTAVQLISALIDLRVDVQTAVSAPRWVAGAIEPGQDTHWVAMESRISSPTRRGLADRGHQIRRLAAWDDFCGHANVLAVKQDTRVITAAADPRGDGTAIAI
jgi:gamma-glutamyltranspeptidase/glutathione hydrolase